MPAWALLSIAPVVGPAILSATPSSTSYVTVMCKAWQALQVSGPSAGQKYVVRNKPSIRNNDLGMCLSNWKKHPNFVVTRSPGTGYSPTVRAYPYIATGCFEGACTATGKTYYMPQAGSLGKYTITWSTKQPLHSGVWNASLDLWFGPRRGVGQFEVMIWLKYSKGSWWTRRYPSVWIDGAKWYVVPHATAPGRHYISFRRATPVTKASLRLAPFAAAAIHRGALASWAKLWCAQAGFEIWSGGKGLAITWFSVTH
jgi:hypothetical protein